MLSIISSAKSLNLEPVSTNIKKTKYNFFPKHSEQVLSSLKRYSLKEIKNVLKLSDSLAELNYQRYKSFDNLKSKSAIFLYHGDVFKNLDPISLKEENIYFLQEHLRIISGLYGILKPLDLIKPYRAEIKTNLTINTANTGLSEYWKELVTKKIEDELSYHKQKILINLASEEYFSVIDQTKFRYPIVNIHFRQKKQNIPLKNIGILAKKARGLMLRFIANQKIDSLDSLILFNEENYKFSQTLSDDPLYKNTRANIYYLKHY